MVTFQSGVLDKTRLLSNILMLALVAGNIFFSIQYSENLKQQAVVKEDNTAQHVATARFLKFFIDTVLNSKGTITYDDRVKLESDVRQLHDADLLKEWDIFVGSKDAVTAQVEAVKMMSLLTDKLLI